GGGDLGVDLVGRDLEQGLVDVDGLAHRLEPAGDGALGDGLAQCGHGHVLALGATAGRPGRGRGLGFSRLVLLAGGSLLLGVSVLTAGGRGLRGLLGAGVPGAGIVGTGAVADDYEIGADLGVVVFIVSLHVALAIYGGGDLGVDLVGRDLEQGLVDVDGLAHRL